MSEELKRGLLIALITGAVVGVIDHLLRKTLEKKL